MRFDQPGTHESEQTEKQRVLAAMRKVVEYFITEYEDDTDPAKKEVVGVDPELREPIAVLLSMGINTDGCCWGHPEERGRKRHVNLLPYISVHGFNPLDGEDAEGRAVGYTLPQLESACTRAADHYQVLNAWLERYYQQHPVQTPRICLSYLQGVPNFSIDVGQTWDWDQKISIGEQDQLIKEARTQWKGFLDFLVQNYLTRSDVVARPVYPLDEASQRVALRGYINPPQERDDEV